VYGVRTAIRCLLTGGALCLASAGCGLDRNGLDFAGSGDTSSTGLTVVGGGSSTLVLTSSGGASLSSSGGGGSASTTARASSITTATVTSSLSVTTSATGSTSTSTNADAGDDATMAGDDGGGDAPAPDSTTDAATGVCSGGWVGQPSAAAGSATGMGLFGRVVFAASTGDQVVALHTTLTVPDEPPASGTVELTPSLRPNLLSASTTLVNTGSVEPTLSWGPNCNSAGPKADYTSWFAEGELVNAGLVGPAACQSGPRMDTKVGDPIEIDLALNGTVWTETLTNDRNGHNVTFDIDLGGQAETFPTFAIVTNTQSPVSDIIFTGTTITFAQSDPGACQPTLRGPTDSFSTPVASASGTQCCLAYIVLRAQGVAATTSL
jgi:hypothetical protein